MKYKIIINTFPLPEENYPLSEPKIDEEYEYIHTGYSMNKGEDPWVTPNILIYKGEGLFMIKECNGKRHEKYDDDYYKPGAFHLKRREEIKRKNERAY
jgi:hypothetical protein